MVVVAAAAAAADSPQVVAGVVAVDNFHNMIVAVGVAGVAAGHGAVAGGAEASEPVASWLGVAANAPAVEEANCSQAVAVDVPH